MFYKKIVQAANLCKDVVKNFCLDDDLVYIVESADWAIMADGRGLVKNLDGLLNGHVSTTSIGVKNKVVHFGSVNTIIGRSGLKMFSKKNSIVLTWYHVVPHDPRIQFVSELNKCVDIIHTSCSLTASKLVELGLDEEKIKIIPLGVDLFNFKQFGVAQRKSFKKSIGLPDNKIIVGSFQKDGNGWGNGDTPKLIKGPDVFCDVVERLSKRYPVHVLLTGPARGYVKNRLTAAGIPFTHHYLENYNKIVNYYNVLDFYLITARVEGGPKAILESMACGVPFVSTAVGMVPDVVADGLNGLVVANTDVNLLVEKSQMILDDLVLRNKLVDNGLTTVRGFDLKVIARRFFSEIYQPLIKNK